MIEREVSLDTARLDEADRLTERRARGGEAARAREESWKESVRAYHAEHREARRHLWITYYRTLARNHALLAEENEARAAALGTPGEAPDLGTPGEGGS